MRTVVCISPHFPPVNAPDMHRLRQDLSYFEEHGWKPVVFCVSPEQVELPQDPMLEKTVPSHIEIHRVGAFPASWTRRAGLGNLGIRCYFQLRQQVSRYLREHEVDLVFFSTTVFTAVALGRYFRRKFGVPFVVDLQDPWRNDYYLRLPKSERPKKFWFDYRQRKWLEARTMPAASGIVAVSEGYVASMRERYPVLVDLEALVLPFGALPADIDVAEELPPRTKVGERIEIVYAGRGGADMWFALRAIFTAFRAGLEASPGTFSRVRFRFVGTSYAPEGKGQKTVMPVARECGLESFVEEQTDRVPYFEALRELLDADVLILPGSEDGDYTASKLLPYIQTKRPIVAVFERRSCVVDVLKELNAGEVVAFAAGDDLGKVAESVRGALTRTLERLPCEAETNWGAFEPYTAESMTGKLCRYFDVVLAAEAAERRDRV